MLTIVDDQPGTVSIPKYFWYKVRIGGLQPGSYSAAVLDITGREVYSARNNYTAADYLHLDLSAVSAKGVYVLKLTDSNGQSRTARLVRE